MKTPFVTFFQKSCLACCAAILLCGYTDAQCVNNLGSTTYDTVLTGNGYGVYNLSFPKWSPDSGLLVSVRINAQVTLSYGFTLKNVNADPTEYSLSVGREDNFSSPALTADYDETVEQRIGVYPLAPGAVAAKVPWKFMDEHNNVDSITGNVVPFVGRGKVPFTYSPVTYTSIQSHNNSSYSYNATAADRMHFSVTYLYCKNGGVLAADLTAFAVTLRNEGGVNLSWSVENERAGRNYTIQRSQDGQTFSSLGSFPSNVDGHGGTVDYIYTDLLVTGNGSAQEDGSGASPAALAPVWTDYSSWIACVRRAYGPGSAGQETGKWFYRLQITGSDGNTSFSPVKQIFLGTEDGKKLLVYPNPATDFINLALPGQGSGSWQYAIYAADGSCIQTDRFAGNGATRINFRNKLSRGIYFVRVVDLQSRQSYFSSFSLFGN